ncbi:MAG: undecaprenyl-phosphate glucose phosphotransferase [Lysobacter sp.]|nr:undecaprenyl-phosphate glucose phosphotransferase [Lysobacter sp.]
MNRGRQTLLKANAGLLEQFYRLSDPLLVVASGYFLFEFLREDIVGVDIDFKYGLALAVSFAVVLVAFPFFRLYQPYRGTSLWVEVQALFRAWVTTTAMIAVLLVLTKTAPHFSRIWMTSWAVTSLVILVGYRLVLRGMLRSARRRGYNLRHVAVVGAGRLGRQVVTRLGEASWTGLHVDAFFDDAPGLRGQVIEEIPVRGTLDDVAQFVLEEDIDQVWLALPLRAEVRARQLLEQLRNTTAEVRFVPDIFGFQLLNHSMTEIAGLPVISLTESPMAGANQLAKAVEDYVIASLILLATSPLFMLIAMGVKLSSPGPVFYRQRRVTWNGAEFEMLKFRSMPVDAETGTGPVWARPGEGRATAFGRFIRRWSLDELPQFVNVLRGEMSIVGPRPERPEFIERFRDQIPGYMQKHLVKAGITGWAQVNDLRGNTDLAKRIEYDLFYIENWSIWFDLRIILLTAWQVVKSRNAY